MHRHISVSLKETDARMIEDIKDSMKKIHKGELIIVAPAILEHTDATAWISKQLRFKQD